MSQSSDTADRFVESVCERLSAPDTWLELEQGELLTLLKHGLVLYAATNKKTLVSSLVPLYQRVLETCSELHRLDCYRSLEVLAEEGTLSLNAFMPFLLIETSLRIVSTATIDYAMLNWPGAEDPLDAVRQLAGFIEEDRAANRGALVGGLICLGDRRVNLLLYPLLDTLTPAEVATASKATTGYPHVGALEFWLNWLKRLPGDAGDPIFGHVAAGLYRLVDQATNPVFFDGERNFGYLHRAETHSMNYPEKFTLEEVAERYGDVFRRLESAEEPPKILPAVMEKYGIAPEAAGV